jgi:hypothetical protein
MNGRMNGDSHPQQEESEDEEEEEEEAEPVSATLVGHLFGRELFCNCLKPDMNVVLII